MQPFRFLHSADLHLDSPFKGMSHLPDSIRDRVRESTFAALQELVTLAVQEQVDLVLISGDVYDLADRSLRAQIRFQKAMQELSIHHIPVFIIHGNHDPLDGRAAKLSWPEGCYIFGTEQVESVLVEREGRGAIARVHGISYRTSAVVDNLALKFQQTDSHIKQPVFEIGMLHTNVEGEADHDNYAPCTKQDLLQSGMNYWALGHVHTRKVINGGTNSGDTCIVYPGNTQGRSVRECGPRGCYIVDVTAEGYTKLTFHPLDQIRWFVETIQIVGMENEQEIKDALELKMQEVLKLADGRSCMIRLVLEGRGPVHDLLRKGSALQDLLDELRDQEMIRVEQGAVFIWPESIDDRTGRVIDQEQLLEQRSFVGDMLRMSRELQQSDDALGQFRDEALSSLLLQSKVAKVLGADTANEDELREMLRAAENLLIDTLADGGWNG